jgi:hypothetical protein
MTVGTSRPLSRPLSRRTPGWAATARVPGRP